VERPEAEDRLKVATHDSETMVLRLRAKLGDDAILLNNGSLEDFEQKVLDIKMPQEHYKVPKKSRFVFGERS
jgi:hypothetical protein